MEAARHSATMQLPHLHSAVAAAVAAVSESVLQGCTDLPAEVMTAAATAAATAVAMMHVFYIPDNNNTAKAAEESPTIQSAAAAASVVAAAGTSQALPTQPTMEGAAGFLRGLVRAELRDIAQGRRSAAARGSTADCSSQSWSPFPRKQNHQQALHHKSPGTTSCPRSATAPEDPNYSILGNISKAATVHAVSSSSSSHQVLEKGKLLTDRLCSGCRLDCYQDDAACSGDSGSLGLLATKTLHQRTSGLVSASWYSATEAAVLAGGEERGGQTTAVPAGSPDSCSDQVRQFIIALSKVIWLISSKLISDDISIASYPGLPQRLL
jgi:hypothetical protein